MAVAWRRGALCGEIGDICAHETPLRSCAPPAPLRIDDFSPLDALCCHHRSAWPNAFFDLCGICCGHFQMPFWSFLTGVILGKAGVKVRGVVCLCLCPRSVCVCVCAEFCALVCACAVRIV